MRLASSLLLLGVLAGSASAQTLVMSSISNSPGVIRWTWGGRLAVIRSTEAANNVRTWVTNGGTNYVTSSSPASLKYMSAPSGSPSTSRTYPSAMGVCNDFEAGQNGDLYATFSSGIFAQIWPSTNTLRTISGAGTLNALTRNGADGNFMCGTFSGYLIKVDSRTYAATTVRSGLPNMTGLEYIPSSRNLLMTAQTGAYIMTTTGSIVRTITTSAGFMNACCVDEVRNELFVANNQGVVYRCNGAGTILASNDFGSEIWSGLDIYQDKKVRITTTGVRGSTASIGLNFPTSTSRPYCCALSLGQTPFQLGTNNYLNMRIDNLFLLTACGGLPYFTSGFAGTLSSSGTGSASFGIPVGLPQNSTLYVGAVALNPSAPNGFDVGNVAVVRVN